MTRFLTFSIVLCLHVCMVAQNQFIKPLVAHADQFNRVLPQETVYLHFDNTGYFVGEKMWYKAYVVSSDGDSLTQKSGVLYVELVDPLGMVVDTHVLKLEGGQGHGEFSLFSHLSAGFYEVRAYTRYMLNFGARGIYSRVFPVFAKPKKEGDYSNHVVGMPDYETMRASQRGAHTEKAGRMHVDFYPEGGHLLVGKRERVAFQLCDRDGNPTSGEGVLLQGKDTVLVVRCDSMGRGVFTFVPDGTPCSMRVCVDGKTEMVALPDALRSGCALWVDAKREGVDIEVSPTDDLHNTKLGVVVSHHGQIEMCDSFVVDGKNYQTRVDVDKLADGVNVVTVFGTSGAILSERLFFVYPRHSVLPIGVEIENEGLQPYDSVTVKAHTGVPKMRFSITVRDAATQLQGSTTDAATYLLLESELKGYIEHAGYYLESDDDEHREATDLLMLVQGWRKYDFETMNGLHVLALNHPAEQKRLLMGQLHPRRKDGEIGGIDLNVVLLHKHDVLKGTSVTTDKGYYTFEMPDCYGNWHMIMRTSVEDKNKDYYIGVNRNFSPEARGYSPRELLEQPLDTPRIWLEERVGTRRRWTSDAHLLQEVKVKARRNRKAGWESETLGAWRASLKYNCLIAADRYADEGVECPSLYDWLKGQNPLFAGYDNISGEMSYRRKAYNLHDDGPSYDNKPVLWFVDNKFMFGTSMPQRLVKEPGRSERDNQDTKVFPASLEECQSVYISTAGATLRHNARQLGLEEGTYVGVFVYTYHQQYHPYKGLRRTYFDGFNRPETFQHNNYRLMPPEPDFRRTLYWNPDVETDEHGDARVGFWNNSSCHQVLIGAEGVARDGKVFVY